MRQITRKTIKKKNTENKIRHSDKARNNLIQDDDNDNNNNDNNNNNNKNYKQLLMTFQIRLLPKTFKSFARIVHWISENKR